MFTNSAWGLVEQNLKNLSRHKKKHATLDICPWAKAFSVSIKIQKILKN